MQLGSHPNDEEKIHKRKGKDSSFNCFTDKASQNTSVNDLVSGDDGKVAFPETRMTGVSKKPLYKLVCFFGAVLGVGARENGEEEDSPAASGCQLIPALSFLCIQNGFMTIGTTSKQR